MSPSDTNDDDDRTRVVLPAGRAGAPDEANAPPEAAGAASSAGDSGNALPLGTYLSEFEVTGVLGEGGFGIVYIAWDHSLQRKVALKEYMPASLAAREKTTVRVRSARHKETFDAGLKSFINEARLLAQFDHPSLVKVYRFWEANGSAYMVMPLYEGTTLKDCVKAMAEPPDEGWLMGLLAPLTEALGVIHAEKCFHRDIAPDNVILLAGSQRPLLLDFGAARRVISDMTQALTVILKPGYAPIEQYAESPDMKQGAWTDVYALAATVHWIITGRTPPPSVSRMLTDSFEPVARSAAGRYSEPFLQALDRALKVRPDERTPSIAAFREDLGLPGTPASDFAPLGGPASGFGDSRLGGAPSGFGRTQPGTGGATVRVTGPAPGPAAAATPEATRSSGKAMWIGAGAAVLAVGVLGGYLVLGQGGKTPTAEPPASPPPSVAAAPAPAPTPAPPPATAPPPAPAFNVQSQLERLMSSQTPDFVVRATPARSQLLIGRDKLSFDVTSNRDGHLHVLLRGPDGSLLLLYPNDKVSDTRIRAGQKVTLPQASWPLDASEPAGSEQFIVFVSGSPRSYADFGNDRDWIFQALPTDARAATLADAWSHATPLLLGAPAKDCQGPACDTYGAAMFTIEVLR